jgi:hypothetical protein
LGHSNLDKFDSINRLIPLSITPLSGGLCSYFLNKKYETKVKSENNLLAYFNIRLKMYKNVCSFKFRFKTLETLKMGEFKC